MILGTLHTNPDRFCDTPILCVFASGAQGAISRDDCFREFQLITAYQIRPKAVSIDVRRALDHRSCFLCSKPRKRSILAENGDRSKVFGSFSQDLMAESDEEARDGASDGVGGNTDA